MSWLTVRNTGAAAVCGAVLIAASPAFAENSPSAPASPLAAEAAAAAKWQAGELNAGVMDGVAGPGFADWGLTIDTIFALSATGADNKALTEAGDAVAANILKYNSSETWDPEQKGARTAGATAKVLMAAVAAHRDPAKFGGFDMRQETLALIAGADAGDNEGRIRDKFIPVPGKPTGVDSSNAFGQSLAVLGLARSGGVPSAAVDFLLKQQCPSGGFRLYPDQLGSSGPTCLDNGKTVLDPDSTGMAVQALLAAAADGKSPRAAEGAKKGAAWLKSVQGKDGEVGGSGPTSAPNTNSTGLAGQALRAAGETAAADKAAGWVKTHQITKENGKLAAAEAGTIAYNKASFTGAQDEGIPEFQRDQWRRATAQALLAMGSVSLGDLGKDPVTPEPGTSTTPSTTPSKSATASATTSTSKSGSAQPSQTLSQTASADTSASPTATATSTTTPAATPPPATAAKTGTTGLARTGAQVGGLVLLAGGLIGVGVAARRAARRSNGENL